MEKEIGKLTKNDTTEIVIRVDDFGGKRGLTVREFVTSERYTGFTKAGVRISPENFPKFKEMVNSVSEDEMNEPVESAEEKELPQDQEKLTEDKPKKESKEELPDY
ncbi:hypothetical protein ACFLZJ_00360 [Nanoarchaeota archaeon]